MGECLACECAVDGHPVGWFAPTFKYMMDAWREIRNMLGDAVVRTDTQERRLELIGGGCIDFWSMDSTDPARGRKYKRAIIDECGIVRELMECWQSSIRPTLVDLRGDAWFLGTPKGRREFFQLFSKGESGDPDWVSFRLESKDNPIIDPAEIEAARRDLPPAVFDQEMRGIPADDGGNPFGMAAIARCFESEAGCVAGHAQVYGIDLAKSQDWTVVVGLDEHGREVSLDRWQQVPWSETIRRIVSIIGGTPALVDSTGVGDPVLEQIQREVPQAEGYAFTAPSKQRLMEGLTVAIQSCNITLHDPILRTELENFGYEYTKTGVRYCMHPNTRILTSDLRWIPVGSAEVGDELLAFDEYPIAGRKTRNWRTAKVLATGEIVRPSYRITFDDGTIVTASAEHKWLVNAAGKLVWKQTDELRAPHPTSKSKRFSPHRVGKLLNVWEVPSSYESGYLAAAFDGEGSLSQTRKAHPGHSFRLSMAQRENTMLEHVQRYLTQMGFAWSMARSNSSCKSVSVLGMRNETLRFLGQIRPKRLLAKFQPDKLGTLSAMAWVGIRSIEYVGNIPVTAIGTSTGTLVAEGMASHNSAPSGLHDDCVCALALAVQCRAQFTPVSVVTVRRQVPTLNPADIGADSSTTTFEKARQDPEWGWERI